MLRWAAQSPRTRPSHRPIPRRDRTERRRRVRRHQRWRRRARSDGLLYQLRSSEDSTEDQIRRLAGEVLVGPGESIVVEVGVNEISGDNVVQLDEPYDVSRLNNEDPDVVRLLDPDQNVVVASDAAVDGDPIEDDDDEEAQQEPDEEEDQTDEDEEQEPAEDEDETEDEDATTDEDKEPEDDEDEKDEADAKGDDKKDDDGMPASEDVNDDCPKVN